MTRPELAVRHWNGFGHERLLVHAADGHPVGTLDLTTGRTTIEDPSLLAQFHGAVAAWQEAQAEIDLREEQARRRRARAELAPPMSSPDGAAPATVDLRDAEAGWLPVLEDRRVGAAGVAGPADGGLQGLVRAWLRRLEPQGWHAVAAVPTGVEGATIDHLLVGPGGVVALTVLQALGAHVWVKGDTFLVDGQRRTDHLQRAAFVAGRAATAMSIRSDEPVDVRPAVVVVNAMELQVKRQPPQVYVGTRQQLPSWLDGLAVAHDDRRVAALLTVARNPRTWSASLPVAG